MNTKHDELEFSFEHMLNIGWSGCYDQVFSTRFNSISGAFIINVKILFQELCFIKCSWDKKLTEEFCEKF